MTHNSYPLNIFVEFLKQEKGFDVVPHSPQFMLAEKGNLASPIPFYEDCISASNIKVALDRLEIDEDDFLKYVCEK